LDFPERLETTSLAKKEINSFLGKEEYHIAVLFASIYANIRLRSLVTDWKNPQKDDWKKTSQRIDPFNFGRLLGTCNKLKLLANEEYVTLDRLRVKRNEVAHESRLWKANIQETEKNEMKTLCESAIRFLEATNEKRLSHQH